MSSPGRVGFVVAGVQKGGTSALFEYLRAVPDLQMPEIKEAHFFDDEALNWTKPDYEPYHALFRQDGRLWGEATPIYLYWPNSIARIHAYNPAMRIVLIFRDPIERAWSHWKMEFSKRKETQPFAWCIREGRDRVRVGDPSAPGHHRVYSYVERGFYAAQIDQLFALFPKDQVLMLRSEDLRARPDAVIATICRFLDIAPPVTPLIPHTIRRADAIAYPSVLTIADRVLLECDYRKDLARFTSISGLQWG
jgi:hypothetical protein